MASVIVAVVVAVAALSGAVATNEALSMTASSKASLRSMRRYFVRSDEEHSTAMDSISRRMNASSALHVLEQHEQATPALVQIAHRVATSRSTSLRNGQPQNYGGFAPALKLLNSMVYESMKKYDTEAAKCTDYYSRQCGMLEGIRGEVAASNSKAANCRERTLAAQSQISLLEDGIPEGKGHLTQHELKCKHENHELNAKLKIVLGDISVLTKILEMTDCKDSSMLQLLHCEGCSHEKFVTLDHEGIQKHLSQLKSSVALGLVQESFSQLAEESASADPKEKKNVSTGGMLSMSLPPAPRSEKPTNPCDNPFQGAPARGDKRALKCTISGSPDCTKIQERFALIQAGIQDERDGIQDEMADMDGKCKEMQADILEQLKDADQDLRDEQTKLAESMMCEARAQEGGRLTNKEHDQANGDLKSMMKTCSTNYMNFETELCGLKKIRGELYKMRGTGKPPIFEDCQVSPWEAQECSKPCGGGVQQLTRSVAAQPRGGAKCLPLEQMKSCSDQPCPTDCKLDAWEGWSKCSAECGGGVMQRMREVTTHPRNDGKPCGATSETKACSVQSCEADCELSDWSHWSKCSKDCDSGTRKRQKFIKTQPIGQGSCPGVWDGPRLQYSPCNEEKCKIPAGATTMHCTAELDVVLLIDGSGSLGKKGWEASLKAAETLVAGFEGEDTKAQVSVILFSGPKNWKGVSACLGQGSKSIDLEKTCNIKFVQHFSDKLKMVKSKIAGLSWPKGSTLTSLALGAARSELNNGRKDASSVVVVITDGRPMSYRKTKMASRMLRKSARLLWVPVTRFAPLGKIRQWATRRWEENVVPVKDFDELEQPEVVSRVIADLCPSKR